VPKIIRALPLYVDSRKIAEVSGGSYEHNSNDELQIATEGYMGHSDGADTCRVQANTITPVKGHVLRRRKNGRRPPPPPPAPNAMA